jgi:hypothetical protein
LDHRPGLMAEWKVLGLFPNAGSGVDNLQFEDLARHAGLLTDLDLFTREELDQEPIYRDLWAQFGIGWSVATNILIPTSKKVTLL